MKQYTKLAPFFLLLFLLQVAHAQSDSANTGAHVKLSLNYTSRLHYYGRTDGLKSSGVFPLAEFWLSPDFYMNAAPVFVNNALQHFDYAGTVTTAGYQHNGAKWLTGIYVTKPFYKDNSTLVQSALKAQGGISLTYPNAIVNINGGGDVKFSDKTDFGASAGLDHIIKIQNEDKSVVVIDPGFTVYAGTQNFQRSYYQKANPSLLLFPGSTQQVTEEVSRFAVLAYEATMPIIYAKGKLLLMATPSYIVPQNLVTVTNRPDLSERGENMFYTTLTAKVTF